MACDGTSSSRGIARGSIPHHSKAAFTLNHTPACTHSNRSHSRSMKLCHHRQSPENSTTSIRYSAIMSNVSKLSVFLLFSWFLSINSDPRLLPIKLCTASSDITHVERTDNSVEPPPHDANIFRSTTTSSSSTTTSGDLNDSDIVNTSPGESQVFVDRDELVKMLDHTVHSWPVEHHQEARLYGGKFLESALRMEKHLFKHGILFNLGHIIAIKRRRHFQRKASNPTSSASPPSRQSLSTVQNEASVPLPLNCTHTSLSSTISTALASSPCRAFVEEHRRTMETKIYKREPEGHLRPVRPFPSMFEIAVRRQHYEIEDGENVVSNDPGVLVHEAELVDRLRAGRSREFLGIRRSSRGTSMESTRSNPTRASHFHERGRKLDTTTFSQGLLGKGLGAGPSMATINSTRYRWQSVVPVGYIDWSYTSCITDITPQYSCQSCWAMAAVDAVATMWGILRNSYPDMLSPQEVCDCGAKQCCKGGWPEWAFAYILFNGGISTDNNYPYSATDRTTCLLNSSYSTSTSTSTRTYKITGWEQVPARSSLALMQAVTMQPVVIFLNADSPDFQKYSSRWDVNVYNGNCSRDVTHAVLVVGYRTNDANVGPHWVIKNSWTRAWGDYGYMYLAMKDGDGACGMNMVPAIYPVYYPQGPQPAPLSPGRVKAYQFGMQNPNPQWWNYWKWGQTSYPNACIGIINPCGAGTCYSVEGIARCNCNILSAPAGTYIEMLGVPTSKCVLANPCVANPYANPCGAGTCSSGNDGTYSCSCPSAYVIGSNVDGSTTCVLGSSPPSSRTYTTTSNGDTCESIQAAFGISDSSFKAANPYANCSAVLPPGIVVSIGTNITATSGCSQTYGVKPGDTCASIASLNAGALATALPNALSVNYTAVLVDLNRQMRCPFPLIGQQLCVANRTVSVMPDRSVLCGQIYTTVAADTCASIQSTYGLNSTTFSKLNPGLSCSSSFTAGVLVCVKPLSTVANVTCSKNYTVVFGDTCPIIWNSANLSSTAFFSINKGIKCSALEVGSTVCINSPSLGFADPSISPIPYIVQSGDTFSYISYIFDARCYSYSITAYQIAIYNLLDPYSTPTPGSIIQIPCSKRVGYIDCGCAPSLPVCGTDFTTYPSYCDAMCNFALPAANGICGTCQGNCTGRVGIAPKIPSAGCPAVCPYPTWQPDPNDVTLVVGSQPGKVCTYVAATCDNVCQAVKVTLGGSASTQLSNFYACLSQCLCCSRIPCAGFACPAPLSSCQANPTRCSCSGSSCYWNCSWWNNYYGLSNGIP